MNATEREAFHVSIHAYFQWLAKHRPVISRNSEEERATQLSWQPSSGDSTVPMNATNQKPSEAHDPDVREALQQLSLSSNSFSILRVILTVACRKRSPLRFFQRWLLLLFIGKFIPPIMSLSRRFVDVGEHENGGEYRMIYSLEGEYTIGSRCQHRLVYNLIHSLIIILCACVVCVCVSELCCYV